MITEIMKEPEKIELEPIQIPNDLYKIVSFPFNPMALSLKSSNVTLDKVVQIARGKSQLSTKEHRVTETILKLPSEFQKPVVHKYLDVPGAVGNPCHCTFCLDYELEHRVERSTYQDLYPFGLDTTEPSTEDTATEDTNTEDTDTKDTYLPATEDTAIENITRPEVVVRFVKEVKGMAPASNEEQFKFLISCIRHSNNGKASLHLFLTHFCDADCHQVDFDKVADECKIVTKGAAAKRYERMMKSNGIHQSQSGGSTVSSIRDTPVASPRRKASPSAGSSNKKRKLDNFNETTSSLNTDDDEGLSNIKAESSTTVKIESIKAEPIKEEQTSQECTPDTTFSGGAMGFDGANDSTFFDEFLAFGGSGRQVNGSQAALNGGFASMSMTQATGNGQGMNDSILITD
ncbi:MAG: hypothetical protein ASARMPRED_007250 [Alectoria sarmentosa]|nr:MAG: hypothetical protein ASARMPRED_007250 [Alectoria sarmentosa]